MARFLLFLGVFLVFPGPALFPPPNSLPNHRTEHSSLRLLLETDDLPMVKPRHPPLRALPHPRSPSACRRGATGPNLRRSPASLPSACKSNRNPPSPSPSTPTSVHNPQNAMDLKHMFCDVQLHSPHHRRSPQVPTHFSATAKPQEHGHGAHPEPGVHTIFMMAASTRVSRTVLSGLHSLPWGPCKQPNEGEEVEGHRAGAQQAAAFWAQFLGNLTPFHPSSCSGKPGGEMNGFVSTSLPDMHCTTSHLSNSSDSHVLLKKLKNSKALNKGQNIKFLRTFGFGPKRGPISKARVGSKQGLHRTHTDARSTTSCMRHPC